MKNETTHKSCTDRLTSKVYQTLWSCRMATLSKTMACKTKCSVTKNKALSCALTQNTPQTCQFLLCQHKKKAWEGEKKDRDNLPKSH